MIGHVLPESKNINVGFFQNLRKHVDQEIRVGLQHLLHKGGVIVEERAKGFHAHQIALRAKESAPAVGDDHKGKVAIAQAAQTLAPVRPDTLGQIRLHSLPPIFAEVLACFHRIANELRHRA